MMTQEQAQDRSALRWIRGELDQTLREARISLEDFVERQDGGLQACVDNLHHVHGALDMVQVYGGAMLADEMEQLALALSQGQVKRVDAAAEALMLGMVQLPAYLEKVETGGADIPLALLPLMNDLRSSRDAPLVSETSLFAPKLDAVIAADTVRPGSGNRELPQLILERRSHFHRALLNWIRGQAVHTSLSEIRDLLDTLNSAAGTGRFRRLLDAGEALATALMDDEAAPAVAVRPLFGKLDRVFKQVIDQGEEAAMLDFPVDLLKNLLYYIARSDSQDPAVVAVRRSADLANSFPDQLQDGAAPGSFGGPDREMFQAVGDALAQDLRWVKDQLDLFMRSDRSQLDRLTDLAQPVQRIGDTLGMVGRGDLRTRLKRHCDELLATGEAVPADEQLMAFAGDLLLVESAIAGLGADTAPRAQDGAADAGSTTSGLSEGEMRQHIRAAVDEALVELRKTKDAILAYLEKPDQASLLADVPGRLHQINGALQVLALPEAGRLLKALDGYIAGLIEGRSSVPHAGLRDAIADLVVSAELYIQSAVEPGAKREHLMAIANVALRTLGLDAADTVAGASDTFSAEDVRIIDLPTAAANRVEQAATLEAVDRAPYDFEDLQQPLTELADTDETDRDIVEPDPNILQVKDDILQVKDDAGPGTDLDTESADASDAPDGAVLEEETVVDVDSEILEIFAEEADEELERIQDCYPKWRNAPSDRESLATVRRSFHTLKGSGRMVGASNIGEFAWAIENLLNRVIDGTVQPSPELYALMNDSVEVLPQLVAESSRPGAPGTDVSAFATRAFDVANEAGEPEAAGQEATGAAETVAEAETASTLDAETVGTLKAAEAGVRTDMPGESHLDLSTLDRTLLDAPGAAGAGEDPGGHADCTATSADPNENEGSTTTAGADGQDEQPADESILTSTEVQDSDFSQVEPASLGDPDTSLYAVFVNEVQGHLQVLGDFLALCCASADGCAFDAGVRRAMHTLHGSALTAGMTPIAEVAGALEALSNVMCDPPKHTDAALLGLLERGHSTLSGLVGAVEDPDCEVGDWASLRDELRHTAVELARPAAAPEDGVTVDGEEDDEEVASLDPDLLEVFLEEAKELVDALEGELNEWQEAAPGDSLLVVKLQRTLHTIKGGARLAGVGAVGDLSHSLESVFESICEQRVTPDSRLGGLVRHATDALAHDIELLIKHRMPGPHPALVERLEAAAHGREWEDVAATEAVIAALDGSPAAADIRVGEPVPEPSAQAAQDSHADADADGGLGLSSELLDDTQLLTDSELLSETGTADSAAATAIDPGPEGLTVSGHSKVIQFPNADQPAAGDGFVPRRPIPSEEPAPVAGTERVRVASEVLDQMVNNAGEVSIFRARLEQMNGSFAFNLGELEQTTDRLRAQLRDLEIETEAQILSRHERESDARTDFDPLELDRYSTMQQLSRALSETVEDLSNLGQSLRDLSRDTDTLLLQQSRVTTDLQDSLLRTRMVKFSSRVPRLERVVRQTSHSLGKQARLEVIGGMEDMDRAVLERMMSPLEHLLRNAVSHGIEEADSRLAGNKPPQGRITLNLQREGTDIVLTLSDDGAGLDCARIRAKAIDRGLLEASAQVKDQDLYQMILQPGFSTAAELSQVSGRGVGMDVVLTEVKQLGGSLEIDSKPGQGTRFVIRLPLTLAITDSLLVTVGDDIYAVPHSSMDGVVRIDVDELRAIYAGEQPTFRNAERDYDVRYLGAMLGKQAPHLSEGVRRLPLLLVHSGEHRVAIQVDGLLGNRQIVVKSVGAQLSTVRWFTGATILADGQIALILDVNTLVRMDSTHQPPAPLESAAPASKGVTVMVVDDSITVRKVTSRLLERHNMHVITAMDGVDAVTQLQEYQPDVMLLDIEMPRMNGFELARHMRSTPELAHIPIIMITSRTGDKHRNRAHEVGVKRYLGKPYQESDLLDNIYTVLADTAQ